MLRSEENHAAIIVLDIGDQARSLL